MSCQILIADDHPVVHDGIHHALSKEAGFELVSPVLDCSQLADSVNKHEPKILITEARLKGQDVLRTLEDILPTKPDLSVIVFTDHDDSTHIARSSALGCYEFIPKSQPAQQLVAAVKNAAQGTPAPPSSLLQTTRTRLRKNGKPSHPDNPLTNRENQVIRHIAEGLSNREIGKSLEISVETVKEHVQNILRKLNVNDRTQAAIWALKKGWV